MNDYSEIDQKFCRLIDQLDKKFDHDDVFIIGCSALLEYAFFSIRDPIKIFVSLNSAVLHQLYRRLPADAVEKFKLRGLDS